MAALIYHLTGNLNLLILHNFCQSVDSSSPIMASREGGQLAAIRISPKREVSIRAIRPTPHQNGSRPSNPAKIQATRFILKFVRQCGNEVGGYVV